VVLRRAVIDLLTALCARPLAVHLSLVQDGVLMELRCSVDVSSYLPVLQHEQKLGIVDSWQPLALEDGWKMVSFKFIGLLSVCRTNEGPGAALW
jgi:hypothetical protein